MFKPFLRLVRFGGLAFVLGGCLFDDFDVSPLDVPNIKDDEPYVRALLDSNGLKDVRLYEVMKLEDPDGRDRVYYRLALGKRGLTKFRFIPEVAKIKAVRTIDLGLNEISKVPEGILIKKWTNLSLGGNSLCKLTRQDSLLLQEAKASWSNQICKIQ